MVILWQARVTRHNAQVQRQTIDGSSIDIKARAGLSEAKVNTVGRCYGLVHNPCGGKLKRFASGGRFVLFGMGRQMS